MLRRLPWGEQRAIGGAGRVAQPVARCREVGGIGRKRQVAQLGMGVGCSRRPKPQS